MNRELWIDYVKASGCICIVIFHVILGLQNAGLYVYPYLRIMMNVLDIFQLGIFFFASGYIYEKNNRIKNLKEWLKFIGKKAINILIPYFVFSMIYIVVNMTISNLTGGVNTVYSVKDIYLLPVKTVAQYWFLYYLFFFFCIISLLQLLLKNNYFILILLMIIDVLNFVFDLPMSNFTKWILFFYLGIIFCNISIMRFSEKRLFMLGCFLLFIIGIIVFFHCGQRNYIVDRVMRCINVSCMVLLIKFLYEKSKMFCVVFGRFIKYYFVIYLLHTIFTAGIRIVLIKMGIVNSIVHTIIGCCIGITVPMLIGYILSKIKYGEIAIYPHRTVMKNRNWGIMR